MGEFPEISEYRVSVVPQPNIAITAEGEDSNTSVQL